MRMRRFILTLAAIAAIFAVATSGRAIVLLMTAGGMDFDIVDTSTFSAAYISDGEANAYDGAYYLDVNGARVGNPTRTVTRSLGMRQVDFAEVMTSTVMVKRQVYVPTSGGEYARFFDTFRNPGTADVTINIRVHGNLGSNAGTNVTGSSDGDMMAEITDSWFGTDDATDGAGSQSVAHVMQGPGALEQVDMVQLTGFSGDTFEWFFNNVRVPAGSQVSLITFAVQGTNNAAARAEAVRLATLPADAMMGIESFLGDVINFPVGGAPIIRLTAMPSIIDEGEGVTFNAMITDREMDPFTFSWDLDDDGTFGENAGMMTYSIPMDMTDGDRTIRVGVEASDGTESRQVYRSLTIRNLPPEFTSTPPTDDAFVGAEWRYDVVWTDPAGDLDFPVFAIVSGPMGMDVSRGGVVRFTPTPMQRDMTFMAELQLDDGDGAVISQMFDVVVNANRAPGEPRPMSPINRDRITERMPTLVVQNATDPDDDRLSYFFRMDNRSSFDSPFMIQSPEIVETSSTTSWTVPTLLEPGQWFWQVKASDGSAESPWINAVFIIGSDDVDAGPMTGTDGSTGTLDAGPGIAPPPMRRGGGGCCAVAVGADSGEHHGGTALVTLFLLGLLARRRRR